MSKNKNRSTKNKSTRPAAASVEDLRATAVVAPVLTGSPDAVPAKAVSIRNTIRTGLIAGASTKELTATVQALFPASKAATKSSTHISYYRSQLRKEGKLPKHAA